MTDPREGYRWGGPNFGQKTGLGDRTRGTTSQGEGEHRRGCGDGRCSGTDRSAPIALKGPAMLETDEKEEKVTA